tara:strand:+ start:2042 stop:2209 length:168 start_codon:yes stop_codon:yes gene_type:complete
MVVMLLMANRKCRQDMIEAHDIANHHINLIWKDRQHHIDRLTTEYNTKLSKMRAQ